MIAQLWDREVRRMIATGRMPNGARLTPKAVADEAMRHFRAHLKVLRGG